ncbi:MAG: ATP-binding protein [Pseudomonadota bacterium]
MNWFFVAHVALFSVFPLYFSTLPGPTRRVHFLAYLSIVLVIGGFLGNAYSLSLADGVTVSGGNISYGAFMMTSILFVLLERDVFVLRQVVRLVVIVNLFNISFSIAASVALSDPAVLNPHGTPPELFQQSTPLIVLGGVLIISELLLLLYWFERVKRFGVATWLNGLAYLVGFVVVLCLDGILFPLIAFGTSPEVIAIVYGSLDGKALTAAAFSLPLLFFMTVWNRRFVNYLEEDVFTWQVIFRSSGNLVRELTEKERALERAETARAEVTERILAFAENTPGVIVQWRLEDDGTLTPMYVSDKCLEYWGYTADEMIADPSLFSAHQSDEYIDRFSDAIADGTADRGPIAVRLPVTRRDGKAFWLEMRGQTAGPDADRRRIDGIFIDVTREVDAEAEAKRQADAAARAQRMESIGQLTGGVAHDFNNLLTVSMGNLELLREETKDPQKLELIDASLNAATRGADLTRSLLAYARKTPLEPERLDVNGIVDDAKTWMKRALPAAIDVKTSLAPDLAPVRLDATSLESALLNLLVNARDAMGSQGTLTIETSNVRLDEGLPGTGEDGLPPGDYVILSVADTGAGIPEDALERIFEPFFSTKAPGFGSGLGLSMVLGFVKQSRGTVKVETSVGEGTTFRLYFPTDAAHLSAPKKAPERAIALAPGRNRVLLAEDDASVSKVLATILERAGYEVTPATTGDLALTLFKEEPAFDVAVIDIVMPGTLQGTDLAEALRTLRPGLPIVFLSGYLAEDLIHTQKLRPDDIRLIKPVPKDDLLDAVARAIAEGKPNTELPPEQELPTSIG